MENKNSQMLISIIVPIYNSQKYLDELLKSITAQTYQNIEIILIDDGSTDDSELICKNFIKNDTRARYIRQKNSGVSTARNKGIEESSGDFIYFVDSDDKLYPEAVRALYNSIVEKNSNLAIGNYSIIDEKEELIVSVQVADEPYTYIENILKGREHAALWNKLISRKLIGKTRFNSDLSYMEDQVFLLEILDKEVRLSYIINSVYKYRLHPFACTSELTQKSLKSRVLAVEIVARKFDGKISENIINHYKANCVYFLILNSNDLSNSLFPELELSLISLKFSLHKKLIIWFHFKKFYRTLRLIKFLKSLR